jgi:hypothetical protein
MGRDKLFFFPRLQAYRQNKTAVDQIEIVAQLLWFDQVADACREGLFAGVSFSLGDAKVLPSRDVLSLFDVISTGDDSGIAGWKST